MSGGINSAFRSNPRTFMSTHLFNSDPHNAMRAGTGVRLINLAISGSLMGKPVTEVQPGAAERNNRSHAFNAYYLAWKRGLATTIQLGTGADYFFTAALTGCRLIIGAGTQPLMTHVDGGRFNNTQMDAMCNVRANGTNTSVQRYWDNGEWYASVVVGVRSRTGWAFYAQGYNPNSSFPLTTYRV